MAFDLLLRGGLLVDGSGGPARPADVGVRGDRITAIGEDPAVHPAGVRHVIVNGWPAVLDGEETGERRGRLLRRDT